MGSPSMASPSRITATRTTVRSSYMMLIVTDRGKNDDFKFSTQPMLGPRPGNVANEARPSPAASPRERGPQRQGGGPRQCA